MTRGCLDLETLCTLIVQVELHFIGFWGINPAANCLSKADSKLSFWKCQIYGGSKTGHTVTQEILWTGVHSITNRPACWSRCLPPAPPPQTPSLTRSLIPPPLSLSLSTHTQAHTSAYPVLQSSAELEPLTSPPLHSPPPSLSSHHH